MATCPICLQHFDRSKSADLALQKMYVKPSMTPSGPPGYEYECDTTGFRIPRRGEAKQNNVARLQDAAVRMNALLLATFRSPEHYPHALSDAWSELRASLTAIVPAIAERD